MAVVNSSSTLCSKFVYGMVKAIFMLFQIYYRIEQISKCVDIVGISLRNRYTNMDWEKTRKNPDGGTQDWRCLSELTVHKICIFLCECMYMYN